MAAPVNGVYGATFPEIVVDKSTNYPNSATLSKKLTVEEWNDLLHHTHVLRDIVDDNGVALGDGGSFNITAGVSAEEHEALKNRVTELENLVTALQATIANLSPGSSSDDDDGLQIGDWDVTRPGIQGPND